MKGILLDINYKKKNRGAGDIWVGVKDEILNLMQRLRFISAFMI